MPFRELMTHCSRLCACKTVGEAANLLASCLRESLAIFSAGVFLTDYSGEHFILSGREPLPVSEHAHEFAMVPLSAMEDPVVYCAHTGTPGRFRNNFHPSPPSLRAFMPSDSGDVAMFSTYPLLAPGDRTIGVVILAHEFRTQWPEGLVEILCYYGSAIINGLVGSSRNFRLVQSLQEDLRRIRKEQDQAGDPFGELVGDSPFTRQMRGTALKVAASDVPVIITGETGTGKSFLARLIHKASARRKGPFMEINCGAIPESLLESELFGYVKGAFSGASNDRPGLFRSGNGGTVFLDEIGEMPVQLQATLLQVLQDLKVRPVGSTNMFPVDVRIIAATNKDLESAMERGDFRPDLYHRISMVKMRMPPLAERKEDVPPLAHAFFEKFKKKYGKRNLKINKSSLQLLYAHAFPGNIRELASIIEREVMLADPDDEIRFFEDPDAKPATGSARIPTLADFVMQQEKEFINNVYTLYAGDIRKCGELLGIHPKTVARKIRQFSQKG